LQSKQETASSFHLNTGQNCFKAETIQRFIRYFKKIVSVVVEKPGLKLSGIDIMSREEKNQILYNFNDTEEVYAKDKPCTDF